MYSYYFCGLYIINVKYIEKRIFFFLSSRLLIKFLFKIVSKTMEVIKENRNNKCALSKYLTFLKIIKEK